MMQRLLTFEPKHLSCIAVNQGHLRYILRIGDFPAMAAGARWRANLCPAFWLNQPQIRIGHIIFDAHFRRTGSPRAMLIIIIKTIWHRDIITILISIFGMRLPFPVRRFMMAHQKERLAGVTCLQPVQRLISDDIGCISGGLYVLPLLYHQRVKIIALPRQHRPEIKACRLMRRALAQMPFADNRGLISTGL